MKGWFWSGFFLILIVVDIGFSRVLLGVYKFFVLLYMIIFLKEKEQVYSSGFSGFQ